MSDTPQAAARRYRKKPVVVEAIRFDGTEESINTIREWASGAGLSVLRPRGGDRASFHALLEIPTLEGDMRAQPGDWIIKGVKGEFYPCKPEIFEATYEPA